MCASILEGFIPFSVDKEYLDDGQPLEFDQGGQQLM